MVKETAFFWWFWHVLKRGEDKQVDRILAMEVAAAQGRAPWRSDLELAEIKSTLINNG